MFRLLHKRPWLLVVVAFLLLIAAWTTLVMFARRHGDVPVPLAAPSPSSSS